MSVRERGRLSEWSGASRGSNEREPESMRGSWRVLCVYEEMSDREWVTWMSVREDTNYVSARGESCLAVKWLCSHSESLSLSLSYSLSCAFPSYLCRASACVWLDILSFVHFFRSVKQKCQILRASVCHHRITRVVPWVASVSASARSASDHSCQRCSDPIGVEQWTKCGTP